MGSDNTTTSFGGNTPNAFDETSSDNRRMLELQEENRRLAHELNALEKRLEDRENAGPAMDAPEHILKPHQRAASKFLHLALASAQNIVMILDQNGCLVAGSNRFLAAMQVDSFEQIYGLYIKNLYALFGDKAFAETGEKHFLTMQSGQESVLIQETRIAFPSQEGWCFYTMQYTSMQDGGDFAGVLVECHDTTAARRAEADQYAKLMLDATPLMCTLWDMDGNPLDCNQEAVRLLGLRDKSDYAEHFYTRVPAFQPDGRTSRDVTMRIAKEASKTGYYRFEWTSCTATGEPLPLEVTAVLIPWHDSYRVVCYARDLREIKAQQRQTRKAEERSKILLDAQPLGVVLMEDREGKILDCNQACLRIFGCTDKAEFMNRFHELSPELQPDGTASNDGAVARIQAAFTIGYQQFDWMYRTASGVPLPTEVTLIRIPWQDAWHVAAYMRDLRDSVARREAEERARLLLDFAPMGITIWDSECRLIDCNQAWLRMAGLATKADFINRFHELYPEFQPDGTLSRDWVDAKIRMVIETGHQRVNWMHRTISGEPLQSEVTLIRMPWKDQWCVAAYTRDLREGIARQEAEERSKMLREAIPLGAALWDQGYNIIDCNQAVLRMLGIADTSEYINRFYALSPEYQPDGRASREKVIERIDMALATGYQHFEWMHLAASGDLVPTEITLVRLPWKGGWCVAMYILDLRERLARDEAVERSRILLDSIPIGAALWDQKLNVVDCNQACLRIFGLSDKRDFVGRFYELSPELQPDGTVSSDGVIAKLHATHTTGYQQFEWVHCTLSGEPVPMEVTLVRVPWEGGWGITSCLRDLREVKIQEQQEREAEERYRLLLDSTPLGAVLWKDGVILECNYEMLRMFGFSNKYEYIDQFYTMDPEFQPDGMATDKKRALLLQEAEQSGYQRFEWMYRLPASGELVPAEVTLVRIPWKGGWCIAAYSRDLREVKAHEQKMREAREHAQRLTDISRAAQIASQAKSDFVARMSHELRTPLNAVIGFLGVELQKDLPQETCDHLETSLDACYNLLNLINDILDISKIESGRFELNNENYHLVQAINEVISFNSFRMVSTNITFRLELDEHLPSRLNGDDLRIKQVLNNLLSNALKYTEKGMVTFSIACAPPASGEKEQTGSCLIRFSVRDTGQGIKAENLKALFTSYTRFDSKANRLIEGTGLGLAISKNLAEMMGGRIEVQSEYGKGSDFSCIIPQTVVDPTPIGRVTVDDMNSLYDVSQRHRYKNNPGWQSSKMPYARVLVVDDVQTNLDVARAMLKRYGMTVDCVVSGQEAVDLIHLKGDGYHAVFMDHMMPGMDGVEALHRIRAIGSDYARSLPVIILTANVVAGNEKIFCEQGFQAFLGKPINPKQLDAIINKWIKNPYQEAHPEVRQRNAMPPAPFADPEAATAPAVEAVCAVEGLDMHDAISRFGSETVVLNVLQSYAANTPQIVDQMRRLVETDKTDLAGYGILAHGMKGASYGVGADALGDMASELELAAANQNWSQVREKSPLFLETAEQLLRDINVLLHARMPAAVPEKDKILKLAPDAGELVALYKASLSCSHSALEAHLQNLEQYRYQSDGELVAWLRMRVDALDYDLISERLANYSR